MEKKARNPGLYLIRAGIQIPVTAICMGVHILVIVQLRREIIDDVRTSPSSLSAYSSIAYLVVDLVASQLTFFMLSTKEKY
jgi:hypothetical protein